MSSGFDVFLGLDVGKGKHHAVGLDPGGTRVPQIGGLASPRIGVLTWGYMWLPGDRACH